jgi:two-component system, response regulator
MSYKVVLLIEDNPSDVELTKRAFSREHPLSTIVVAEDGQTALDYLFGTGAYADRDSHERPALVLLDLKLPIVDGLDVLRHIRSDAHTCRLPVVVLTSSKEEQDIAASYDLGANSYIRKPIDFRQFSDAIKLLATYWLTLNETPPAV